MKKRLSQFIIVVLCLVSTLVISKINTKAASSVNNGVNYETYTVSNLGLVKTQDAYVVKNVGADDHHYRQQQLCSHCFGSFHTVDRAQSQRRRGHAL